jgi:hypothetical protein
MNLEKDWLNPHFGTFMVLLPLDYSSRLKPVFSGSNLKVQAIGREDIIIMKAFARRPKDATHIRFLKKDADMDIVESTIESLRKIKGDEEVQKALDFIDEY